MNPNEIKLTEFDAEVLSTISWTTVTHINTLKAAGDKGLLISKLREFDVQVIYALSLAKERERTISN